MTKLNKVQQQQVAELGNVTSEDFSQLMLKHTHFLTSEQLEKCYDDMMELEGDYVHVSYDVNYYNVVSEYCDVDTHSIELAFNRYGAHVLYMDELGQGLLIASY